MNAFPQRRGPLLPSLLLIATLLPVLTIVAAPAPGVLSEGITRLGERRFRFDRHYQDILLTPDGKSLLAVTSDAVHLADLSSGEELATWTTPIRYSRFVGITADGKEFATFTHDKTEVTFRDLAQKKKDETVLFKLDRFLHV